MATDYRIKGRSRVYRRPQAAAGGSEGGWIYGECGGIQLEHVDAVARFMLWTYDTGLPTLGGDATAFAYALDADESVFLIIVSGAGSLTIGDVGSSGRMMLHEITSSYEHQYWCG